MEFIEIFKFVFILSLFMVFILAGFVFYGLQQAQKEAKKQGDTMETMVNLLKEIRDELQRHNHEKGEDKENKGEQI